jgi:tripartite-type tricarboxylate transporter receptor subunit TctC
LHRAAAIRTRFTNEGAEVVGSTPKEFGRFVSDEISKWRKVVKAAGIKAEF